MMKIEKWLGANRFVVQGFNPAEANFGNAADFDHRPPTSDYCFMFRNKSVINQD